MRRRRSPLAVLALAVAATACIPRPPVDTEPPGSPTVLVPSPEPAYGLTWALVQDVERPEEAFTLPSNLPTAPSGPGTAGHPGHFPGQAILRDVTVLGDLLVAVGEAATGDGTWTARAWVSPDALHWRLATIDARPGSFAEAVTTNADGIVVAVGRSGLDAAAWTSEDGRTWTRARVERLAEGARIGEPERMTSIWGSGHELVAGGSAGPELGDRRARLWRSDDGRSWEPVADDDAFEGAEVAAIATAPDKALIALGLAGTGQRKSGSVAWRSADGATWTRSDDTALQGGLAVDLAATGEGPPGLVAIGSDLEEREAVAWVSPDGGRTWTRAPAEPSRTYFGAKIRMTGVVATPAGLVAIGNAVSFQYGDGTSWLSRDGLEWTRAPLQPPLGQGEPEAITRWGDGRLVIVGSRGAPDNYIPSAWVSPGLP